MKKCYFLYVLLFLLCGSSFGATVECYSGGKVIFKSVEKVNDVYAGDGFIMLRKKGIAYVLDADCIVNYDTGN